VVVAPRDAAAVPDVPGSAGAERVVISLSDQLAFLYRGDTLVAVSTMAPA